jgi:hypothetical protein
MEEMDRRKGLAWATEDRYNSPPEMTGDSGIGFYVLESPESYPFEPLLDPQGNSDAGLHLRQSPPGI